MQPQADQQPPNNEVPQLKITRIIPKSSRVELSLVPYTIITCQSKRTNEIINILKQMDQDKDKEREKGKGDDPCEENQQADNPFAVKRDKPFLKRVRKIGDKVEVMICKESSDRKLPILDKLEKINIIQKIQSKMLPSQAPVTKSQFEQWSKLWPINFIQHQISREIPHSSESIRLLASLLENNENKDQFCLLDEKGEKVLLSKSGSCQKLTIWHPIMQLLQQWSECEEFRSNPDKYYYLTGLKMLIRKQICGMCSMALVHSRLGVIYMGFKLNEVMDEIMGCRKLNHQIKMFYLQ